MKTSVSPLENVKGCEGSLLNCQRTFTNPHSLCHFLFFFFLLLRWLISPGCVLSISLPPSSPARRRYRATSTAWRSSRAVHSSYLTTTTWSTAAVPASSAQVQSDSLPSITSCLQQQQIHVHCAFVFASVCVALNSPQRRHHNQINS